MSPKTLGHNRTGEETIMGPLILMASFILITIMVITSMSAFLQTASGNWDEIRGTMLIGSSGYTLRNPTDGWDITEASVTDRWDHESPSNVAFYEDTPGEDDEIVIGIIRNNAYYASSWMPEWSEGRDTILYLDFIMVYTEFGLWDHDDWPISYDTIASNQVEHSNISVTEFGIRHNTTFALIITVDAPYSMFSTLLWANTFNIKIGTPDTGEDLAGSSMWTILGQVMTASLPEVSYEINLIIGATIYAGIGVIAFTVITRALPSWLSGG